MIDRYSREEIKKIWDLGIKFDYYLKVEIAVCEAYAKLGLIPQDALNLITTSSPKLISAITSAVVSTVIEPVSSIK